MRSYVIGRSPYADIVIPDPTVARRHAELVATDDGRFYLTDCVSESGTWRRAGEQPEQSSAEARWSRVRQAFVAGDEPLRFGEHQTSLDQLLGPAARNLAAPRDSSEPGRWRWDSLAGPEGEPATAGPARPRGKVERDPVTGEIVAKRW